MRKLLFLMTFISLNALAQFKESTHYEVLNHLKPTQKAQVTEFFSYLCPHCYSYEMDYIPKLKESLKKNNIGFEQSHVDFIGGQKLGKQWTTAHAMLTELNINSGIKNKMFETAEKNRNTMLNDNDMKKFFLAQGVKEKKFDQMHNSMLLLSRVSRMQADAKNSRIKGVPSFVVNSKYLVKTESVKSFDELTNLIIYLSKKDQK